MTEIVLCIAILLAFANGANDNLKGVATLVGSGLLEFRSARWVATLSTGLGSILSVLFATALVRAFSGKGLVPADALTPEFLASAGLGAAATVGLATWRKMPISTTHALVGGLVGAGLASVGGDVALGALGKSFVLPLLVGPLLAVAGAWLLARSGGAAARGLGIRTESCICIEGEWQPLAAGNEFAMVSETVAPRLVVDDTAACEDRVVGEIAGVEVQTAIDRCHLLSASLVGFARGLNDTPKILGLMAGVGVASLSAGAAAIGFAMAAGGWWASRGVTETLALKVTQMTSAEGLAGNLTTSLLVIGASRLGLPVSTTHVSAGGIFGVGASNGAMRMQTVLQILGAWLLTLPVAATLSALTAHLLGAVA